MHPRTSTAPHMVVGAVIAILDHAAMPYARLILLCCTEGCVVAER
jgi:hypothetical protein